MCVSANFDTNNVLSHISRFTRQVLRRVTYQILLGIPYTMFLMSDID
jgi:hypothetical protein